GAPQRKVAGFELEVDGAACRQPDRVECRILHRRSERLGRTIHMEIASQMASRDEAHSARFRPVRIDRKASLDVGGRKVAVSRRGPARAAVLMPGEIAERARRLPMN